VPLASARSRTSAPAGQAASDARLPALTALARGCFAVIRAQNLKASKVWSRGVDVCTERGGQIPGDANREAAAAAGGSPARPLGRGDGGGSGSGAALPGSSPGGSRAHQSDEAVEEVRISAKVQP